LDAANPGAAPATIQFTFEMAPATVTPTLTGSLDVEISFDDPDGGWAATWSAQAGSGTSFTVMRLAGATKVRLGTTSLQLAAVPLLPSQSTVATGAMAGTPMGTGLNMQATISDAAGHLLAVIGGICTELPRP
jgi:hypothetical protein